MSIFGRDTHNEENEMVVTLKIQNYESMNPRGKFAKHKAGQTLRGWKFLPEGVMLALCFFTRIASALLFYCFKSGSLLE